MRRVEFCKKGWFGGIDHTAPFEIQKGYFHGFYQDGDFESGVECFGLIETDDGILHERPPARIRFLDKPKKKIGSRAWWKELLFRRIF